MEKENRMTPVFRVYIETEAGAKDEIGDGYSVGPGM